MARSIPIRGEGGKFAGSVPTNVSPPTPAPRIPSDALKAEGLTPQPLEDAWNKFSTVVNAPSGEDRSVQELNELVIPDDPTVTRLAELVNEAGGRAVLVGGAVRDQMLGRESKDYDIEVTGIEPEALESLLQLEFGEKVDLVGASFAVYKINQEIDVSLPRTEKKIGEGYKGFEVTPDPHLTPSEAAARRDFTINAVGLDLSTGEIVDPFNGRDDLANFRLRHVGSQFGEDPLRVLRGAQFAATSTLTRRPSACARLSGKRKTLSPRNASPQNGVNSCRRGQPRAAGSRFFNPLVGWNRKSRTSRTMDGSHRRQPQRTVLRAQNSAATTNTR